MTSDQQINEPNSGTMIDNDDGIVLARHLLHEEEYESPITSSPRSRNSKKFHTKDNLMPPLNPPAWESDMAIDPPQVPATYETFAHHLLHDEEYNTSPFTPTAATEPPSSPKSKDQEKQQKHVSPPRESIGRGHHHHLKDNFDPSMITKTPPLSPCRSEDAAVNFAKKHRQHPPREHARSLGSSPSPRGTMALDNYHSGQHPHAKSLSSLYPPSGGSPRHLKDNYEPKILRLSKPPAVDFTKIGHSSLGSLSYAGGHLFEPPLFHEEKEETMYVSL